MPEIKKKKQFLSSRRKKGKMMNVPVGERGQLTRDGLVYKNDLLDTDITSQTPTRRKLKGV